MKWSAFKPQDCDTAPFRPHLWGTILGDASWSCISGLDSRGFVPHCVFGAASIPPFFLPLTSPWFFPPLLFSVAFVSSPSLTLPPLLLSETSPLFFSTSTCCSLFPNLALIFYPIFPLQSLRLFSSLLQVIFFSFLIRLYLFFLVKKKKKNLTPALHDFNDSSEQSSSESFLFVCPQTIL